MTDKYTTVSIPKPLYEKMKKRVEKTGFTSVSDYVTYILREVMASIEEEKNKKIAERGFNKKDEEKVKERLRALGYLG